MLLKAGADPKADEPEGQTALMSVARTGNVEAAKLLLKAGADVNAREHWGRQTALMWAASQSQPEMMRLLLKGRRAGLASVGARLGSQGHRRAAREGMNRGGFAAAAYAAREGCVPCIAALLEGRRGHRPRRTGRAPRRW